MQGKRSVLERIIEPVAAIVLFSIIGIFVYMVAAQGRVLAALGLVPVAMIALLLMRLSDITKIHVFKAFEAQLRERLEEVNATISQLHELAETFAQVSVRQLKYGDRMSGINPRLQRQMIDEMIAKLRALQVPEDRIEVILALERPTDHFDYFHYVMKAAHRIMSSEQSKAWEEWSKPFIHQGIGGEPTPDETEAFLGKNGLLSEEVIERLKDYRQFHDHGNHRRVESWLDRNSHK